MAKRGSVEAFKEAEAKRQQRIKSPKASNMSDARKQKRDAFNAKVKSINESRVNKSSLDRFRKAEADRKARVASVNKINPNSPKAKRLRAQADVEKDLPKSAAPSPMAKDRVASAVGAAASTAGSTAGKVASKPIAAPKKESTATPKKSVDLSGFGAAFKKARAEGVGTKFAYNDKMYAAVTRDDISRAGKTSLQDFLNSTKRTETKIAKAPGQREEAIVKKRSGGTITPSRQQRLRGMMQKQKEKNLSRREELKKILPRLSGTVESMNTPGMRSDRIRQQMKDRSDAARDENIRLKERSEPIKAERRINTLRSMAEQMQKSPMQDRFKSGGSVMARGCKMGRKKATKLY